MNRLKQSFKVSRTAVVSVSIWRCDGCPLVLAEWMRPSLHSVHDQQFKGTRISPTELIVRAMYWRSQQECSGIRQPRDFTRAQMCRG